MSTKKISGLRPRHYLMNTEMSDYEDLNIVGSLVNPRDQPDTMISVWCNVNILASNLTTILPNLMIPLNIH